MCVCVFVCMLCGINGSEVRIIVCVCACTYMCLCRCSHHGMFVVSRGYLYPY